MKTQIIQLVKIQSSDIYDNIIPDTMILIKSNYDEMKFIVSSSSQKEEIKSEDIFDTINIEFLKKISEKNDISPRLFKALSLSELFTNRTPCLILSAGFAKDVTATSAGLFR